MEKYLKDGPLAKLLTYLTSLPPPRLAPLLTKPIKDLPLLHHLAGYTFHPEDAPQLTFLLTLLTSNDYNLDLKTDHYTARKRASLGFTALLAAVEQSNLVLVTSLITAGASTSVRDSRGFSAYHWAIIVGNLKVLQSLLQNSPTPLPSTDKELEGEDDVHPLLHTALDEGRTEMVFFLLENGFVDPNELAIYKGVLSEQALSQLTSRYNSDFVTLQTVDTPFTPLERAVRMRKIPIIKLLLKSPKVSVSIKELHFCIMEGDTEVACLLIPSISGEDLAGDKIMNKWALHCLHPKAFQDELRLEFTVQLICNYLDSGWDVNAVTEGDPVTYMPRGIRFTLDTFNLLHLACLHEADIRLIQYLVECGANVNLKSGSESGSQMTPLQFLIMLKQWDGAMFLMDNGADPMVSGCYEGVSEEKCGDDDGSPQLTHLNSLELLLRASSADGLPTLKHMLATKDIIWHGASEFRRAIEGPHPSFVVAVLQHCDPISVEDLTWARTTGGIVMPTLIYHFASVETLRDIESLVTLLKLMVTLGYNFSLTTEDAPLDRKAFPDKPHNIVHNSGLIFLLLEIDLRAGRNQLLETFLEVPQVTLNFSTWWDQNPVEIVLHLWNERCLEGKRCWKVTQGSCWKTVKLLLNHGLDCSGMTIGASFRYHRGYMPLIKGLYYAGAKFTPDFFSREEDLSCHPGYDATKGFREEIQALGKWKEEFDRKNGGSLKRACILQVRRMLKTVGHLQILEALPGTLKEEVLLLNESCLIVN